jgi:SPP1 gp7 family putative phage head morphogenesis protein
MPKIKIDSDITPDRALKYFNSLTPALRSSLKNFSDDAKARAFFIANLTKLNHVNGVYKRIAEGIEDGKPVSKIVDEISVDDNIPLRGDLARTIVNTNIQTAYAAGRWEEVQTNKKYRPYLKYLAVNDNRTRTLHRSFDGLILPVDDPFWRINYPPNGYNCRCDVATLSQRQVDKLTAERGENPVIRTKNPMPMNSKFAGNPGEFYKPDLSKIEPVFREDFLRNTAYVFGVGVEDASKARLRGDLKKYLRDPDIEDMMILSKIAWYNKDEYQRMAEYATNELERARLGLDMPKAHKETMMVGRIPPKVMKSLQDNGVTPKFSIVTVDDKQLIHMKRSVKTRGDNSKAVSFDELLKLPEILKDTNSRWYFDTQNSNISIFGAERDGEAIKVSINMKSDLGTPYIVTSGKVDMQAEKQEEYKRIK